MIERSGKHICERCRKSYDWIARKSEHNEVVVGRFNDIKSNNVKYFGIINGRLVATGACPYCGALNPGLVDEEM